MTTKTRSGRFPVAVLLGDPGLADATKLDGRYSDEDLSYVAAMTDALDGTGRYDVRLLRDHRTLLADLAADPPAFILNFCDTGFRNIARHEWHLAGYLELLEIPYSGAPPSAMAVCYDKGIVRALAASLGVAVPDERYFPDAETAAAAIETFPWPVLAKPNHGDGSVGITRDAVLRTPDDAIRYLDYFAGILPGRAVIVQEFLPGTEYGMGVIGNPETGFRFLPALEVDYSGLDKSLNPILSFESKVDPDSPYWTDIAYREARIDPATRARLEGAAAALFPRLGLRDYGRFDFRTAADGTVKLMEVNPNPAWDHTAKLALMSGFAGMSYAEMLSLIVETARTRLGLAG